MTSTRITTRRRYQYAVALIAGIGLIVGLLLATAPDAGATRDHPKPPKPSNGCTYFPEDCEPPPPVCEPGEVLENGECVPVEPPPCAEGEVRDAAGNCAPPVVEPPVEEPPVVDIPRDPPMPQVSKHPKRQVPLYDCGQRSGTRFERWDGDRWVETRTRHRNIDTAACGKREFVESGG